MSTVSWHRFRKSFGYARQGLRQALAMENSFRIHVAVAIVLIGVMIGFGMERLDAAVLIFLISTILTLELVNTVVERFVDILEPRVHPYAGQIKDLMAAGVLITSIAAAVIGGLILWPYFFPS